MGEKKTSNRLIFPEKKAEMTEAEIATLSVAYMQASVDLAEATEKIADCLETLELYFIRKGKKEGIFSDEEFQEGEES